LLCLCRMPTSLVVPYSCCAASQPAYAICYNLRTDCSTIQLQHGFCPLRKLLLSLWLLGSWCMPRAQALTGGAHHHTRAMAAATPANRQTPQHTSMVVDVKMHVLHIASCPVADGSAQPPSRHTLVCAPAAVQAWLADMTSSVAHPDVLLCTAPACPKALQQLCPPASSPAPVPPHGLSMPQATCRLQLVSIPLLIR
jgi:hypothetical protein